MTYKVGDIVAPSDTPKRRKRNYVDKAKFTEELMKDIAKAKEADEKGIPRPPVSAYVGAAFQNIAKGVGSRGNFSGYPFRDDMVQDGIENCLQYYTNFDPEKMKGPPNPHAYFTQIVWYAFLRRIKSEKKQQYIKFKSSQELLALGGTAEGDEIHMNLSTDADYINQFIEDFEAKMEEENNKGKKSNDDEEAPETDLDNTNDDNEEDQNVE